MLRVAVTTLALILLLATTTEATQVTMRWTVPYDDVGVTNSTMRYSPTPVGADTSAWWQTAYPIYGLPVPGPSGTRDSVFVQLQPGTYYFNILHGDSSGNWSSWSNVAEVIVPELPDTTAPFRVQDLDYYISEP